MRVTFTDSAGTELVGTNMRASDTDIVILLHGFSSSKETPSASLLSQRLASLGISSLRYDQFGHGESGGEFSDLTVSKAVNGAVAAFEYATSQGYTRIALWGSSFGGQVALVSAGKLDIVGLGLKAPVVHYHDKEMWSSPQRLAAWKESGFREYVRQDGETFQIKYTFFEDASQYNGYMIGQGFSFPVSIVHGTKDSVVSIEQSRKLAKSVSDCKLVEIDGADHWFAGEGEMEQVVDSFAAFFEKVFS